MTVTRIPPSPDPVLPRAAPGTSGAAVVAGRVAVVLKYVSLVAASLITLVPIVALAMASLKTHDELAVSGPLDPPADWSNLDNYATAFVDGRMAEGFVNTSIILAVALVGTILIGSMAAYAIDRFTFRFRRVVIMLFLLATLVPGVTTQVATFQVVNNLGLFNTRWSAIALFMGTDIISIYIFRQFIGSIPRDLDDAAAIEGASPFTIYWRIILPLLKPAIATVVIIKGITIYNEFYIPFLYMPSRDLGVVSTTLFRFQGPFGAQWEVISAGVILVILPTLLMFLALQRWIYSGLTAGSTK